MAGDGLTFSVGMDPFCYKQFDKKQDNHIPCSKEVFLQERLPLRDGYAPFCKHLFVENFTDAKIGIIPITEENRHLLSSDHRNVRSGYLARTEKELPVLYRWFTKADVAHILTKAKYLDVILYSRDQIIKEHEAMADHQEGGSYDFDYYVVSVKPQDTDQETPIMPITIFRNTMITEGGSGVPIDRAEYLKSVEFWQKNAIIRDAM
ncbi:hypothetical protein X943_002974 [Babesia divergens]|uniref:Uncharacterized protein n=1 Tax=Babesia divergens TaxID=32595 RepID=A0AAD9LEA7_BABDI|nr:hypothetical protein X943_002974 [Babesia divergens]